METKTKDQIYNQLLSILEGSTFLNRNQQKHQK